MELKGHARVIRPDRPIRHVYFPETGVLSVLQQMRNGSSVAVNLVGSDGMVGLGVYSAGSPLPMEAICQAPGSSCACGPEFRAEVARNPPLLRCCTVTQAVLEVGGQSMGCERFHSVEARAARWLLEIDDRCRRTSSP